MLDLKEVRRIEVLADNMHMQRLHRRDDVVAASSRRGGTCEQTNDHETFIDTPAHA